MTITLHKKPGNKKPGKVFVEKKPAAGKTSNTSKPAEAARDYLTLKQAAGILQVCTKTAREIIEKKDIPVRRIGARRQIRIHPRDLELFMEKDW